MTTTTTHIATQCPTPELMRAALAFHDFAQQVEQSFHEFRETWTEPAADEAAELFAMIRHMGERFVLPGDEARLVDTLRVLVEVFSGGVSFT